MCGIFGFSSKKESTSNMLRFNILGMFNESRGGHASGIYSHKNGIKKNNVSFEKFIEKPLKVDAEIIGHTRYGTHGSNIPKNAHPFQFKNVIGTHNGVVSADTKRYEVDSMYIFDLISEKGIYDAIPEISGSMALAFYIGKTLYLYREDNPLYIGHNGGTLFYSSLENSLKAIQCEGIKALTPYTVYSVSAGQITEEGKIAEKTKKVALNWYDYRDDFAPKYSGTHYKEVDKALIKKCLESLSKENLEELLFFAPAFKAVKGTGTELYSSTELSDLAAYIDDDELLWRLSEATDDEDIYWA